VITPEIEKRWTLACKNVGDHLVWLGVSKWYTDDAFGANIETDMQAAFEDAALGDERAQRYVAEFMRLRMTT
jgi:hypothetical protein